MLLQSRVYFLQTHRNLFTPTTFQQFQKLPSEQQIQRQGQARVQYQRVRDGRRRGRVRSGRVRSGQSVVSERGWCLVRRRVGGPGLTLL